MCERRCRRAETEVIYAVQRDALRVEIKERSRMVPISACELKCLHIAAGSPGTVHGGDSIKAKIGGGVPLMMESGRSDGVSPELAPTSPPRWSQVSTLGRHQLLTNYLFDTAVRATLRNLGTFRPRKSLTGVSRIGNAALARRNPAHLPEVSTRRGERAVLNGAEEVAAIHSLALLRYVSGASEFGAR
jgi:hypothetical protein